MHNTSTCAVVLLKFNCPPPACADAVIQLGHMAWRDPDLLCSVSYFSGASAQCTNF